MGDEQSGADKLNTHLDALKQKGRPEAALPIVFAFGLPAGRTGRDEEQRVLGSRVLLARVGTAAPVAIHEPV